MANYRERQLYGQTSGFIFGVKNGVHVDQIKVP